MSTRSPFAPIRSVAAIGSTNDESLPSNDDPILTVSQLNARLRGTIRGLGQMAVEGEVSGIKGASPSGHIYFTLKDEREDASIGCAMFRREAQLGGGERLINGARVRVRGEATIYSPRGALQLVVTKVSPAGDGDLLLRKEALKKKLAAEGLFEPSRKRPIPSDPRIIGVVTSASGAAFHDIVTVAMRRGSVRLLLAPALVQGDDAARQICVAIEALTSVTDVDLIIVGRGGGSAEDLAAFDDERVARAIAACSKPIVSAVGHEVDWSIADLVADVRAATPSQAAELVVPDDATRRKRIHEGAHRLHLAMRARLHEDRSILARIRVHLRAPERSLADDRQRLDDLDQRMQGALRQRLAQRQRSLDLLERRLSARHPRSVIAAAMRALSPMLPRLHAAIDSKLANARRMHGQLADRPGRALRLALDRRRGTLATLAETLQAISPLAVLSRGYAIAFQRATTDTPRRALRSASDVDAGATIEVRLRDGTIDATVVGRHR